MTQYPGYEIERFEDEGGSQPTDQEIEEIPVIDLLGDDKDAGEEIQKHQES